MIQAIQVCSIPISFRIEMGNRKTFTNVELASYLNRTGEQVAMGMCRDEEEANFFADYLYEKGFVDLARFKVKVPPCFTDWAFKNKVDTDLKDI